MILYHGGHRWEGPPTIQQHRRGHAEHGPGIYLTTSWETANKYAKGGGAVYRVTIDPPAGWAESTNISVTDVIEFVRGLLGRGARSKSTLESIERVRARMGGGHIPAFALIAIFVNADLASGKYGPPLAEFLVKHGVDASLVTQGAEDWVVVFNPSIITQVTRLNATDTRTPGFQFLLPKIAHRWLMGG